MTSREPAAPPSDWVSPAPPLPPLVAASQYIKKTLAIAELEVRKLGHDPTALFMRALQPVLWLGIYGPVMSQIRAIPTGNVSYLEFLAPGILAQSVLFIAIFYGLTIIWERDLGIVAKFLASPTPRSALVLGKALSAGVRGLSQAVIVYLLALVLGVRMNWHPLALCGILAMVFLGAACFSTFSLMLACLVKQRERFLGIGQAVTMPLFFISNALYPVVLMPGWLQALAHFNPLTYEVDALRSLMVVDGVSTYGLGVDFLVMAGFTALLVAIGGRLYAQVVY